MSGELEGVGQVVTGAMLASAVEPGTSGDGRNHETACLNCGQPLNGAYCSACGQKAHAHRTLSAFAHDFVHGILHVDGKAWRTFVLLLWHPGQLTRRYIEGQRARFVSPMALFLFSVFVMFAVLSATIKTDDLSAPQVTGNIEKAIVESKKEIAGLERERARTTQSAPERAEIDDKLAKARDDLASLETMKSLSVSRQANLNLSQEMQWLEQPIRHAIQNPDLVLYKIRNNAYKWSWVVIPLSVPFLWLLFPFSRRFTLYDHVVFVTYSLSFMSLLAVLAALLFFSGLPGIAGFLFFLPPVHFYRQLKEAYALTTFGALWRALALTVFAIIALSLFALLMALMGVL